MVPGTMAMRWVFARSWKVARWGAAVLQERRKSGDSGCQDVRMYSGRMARLAPSEAAALMCWVALSRLYVGERGWEHEYRELPFSQFDARVLKSLFLKL